MIKAMFVAALITLVVVAVEAQNEVVLLDGACMDGGDDARNGYSYVKHDLLDYDGDYDECLIWCQQKMRDDPSTVYTACQVSAPCQMGEAYYGCVDTCYLFRSAVDNADGIYGAYCWIFKD